MKRIKIEDAAKRLNMCQPAVRTLMDKGELPIGIVKHSRKRNTYYIYDTLLDEFLKGRLKNV